MQSISVLMKPSSGMCNMHCDYCFYCDEIHKRDRESYGFMSDETLKNVIRRTLLRVNESAFYAFQGGEPTLRGIGFYEKVLEYEEQYNKNHVNIQNAIQTNGYLIDEKWCELLKKNNFLVGVSVDGTKEIHDKYRHNLNGNPTYDIIRSHIMLMEEYGVEYNILTVVNKETAENIADIYRSYKENRWMYQQYIACLDPLDEKRGNKEYALTPDVYGKFLVELFGLWYKDWKKGKQPYIRQFENYVGILAGYSPEACNQRGVCGVQHVIEADGSVYPCDFYVLDEYRLGNFNEDHLDKITEKRSEIGFIERSYQLNEECRNCKYYRICRGGCQRDREWDPVKLCYNNYFCSSFKYFFDRCYEQLTEIAKFIKIV